MVLLVAALPYCRKKNSNPSGTINLPPALSPVSKALSASPGKYIFICFFHVPVSHENRSKVLSPNKCWEMLCHVTVECTLMSGFCNRRSISSKLHITNIHTMSAAHQQGLEMYLLRPLTSTSASVWKSSSFVSRSARSKRSSSYSLFSLCWWVLFALGLIAGGLGQNGTSCF